MAFDLRAPGPYHARAMSNPLRDRRLVTEMAASGQVIEFAEKIGSFKGLAAIAEAELAALETENRPSAWREKLVSGKLQFGFVDAADSIPRLLGSVETRLAAVCQRCLEPFEITLRVEPELLLLDTDKVAHGYEDLEVWELDEPSVVVGDIVEELLIMAMPFSAMHDNKAECKVLSSAESPADEGDEDLVKPFAALRQQMKQNEKDPET